jgi:hypothetical protein
MEILRGVGGEVRSLLEFCLHFAGLAHADLTAPYETDADAFGRFLHTTWLVFPLGVLEPAACLTPVSRRQSSSQLQLLQRAIEILFQRSSSPSHILCLGYTREVCSLPPAVHFFFP